MVENSISKSLSDETLTRNDSGIDIVANGEEIDPFDCKTTDQGSLNNLSSTTCEFCERQDELQKPETWKEKLWPPRGPVAKWITWFLVLGLLYGALWSLRPEAMMPCRSEFGLILTIILCFIAEQLVVKIPTPKGLPPLPPLLASLLMGLALRNLPEPLNIAKYIDQEVSSVLRELALTVILTRAGLEIDAEGMKKVKWAVIRLAFMPCIAETLVIGVLAHYILGFPFLWSFMAGFMIAAVSPAVVIPSLIILQDVGFGVAKGVPALVMAASGIDDVLAIAGFTVLLGLALPTGIEETFFENESGSGLATTPSVTEMTTFTINTTCMSSCYDGFVNQTSTINQINIGKEIGGAIIEVIIGIVAGLVLGFFLSHIPPKGMKYKSFCRGALLLSIGVLFVFGSAVWGIPGSGALCALITSFTASLHWKEERKPLEVAWHYMWVVFQPILFGLTGTLVDVSMMDATTVGLGLAVLGCGLVGRLITSTSVTFGLNLNIKERIFISIAWIPKGTVQAALGSAALDMACQLDASCKEKYWGQQILVLAVLITLITAPIGALAINIAGPKLLSRGTGKEPNPADNEAYMDTESQHSDISTDSHNYKDNELHLNSENNENAELHLTGLKWNVYETISEIQEVDDKSANAVNNESTRI